jgi:hypothetical protein
MRVIRLSGQYKRIDMNFLQMCVGDQPAFAILPYNKYQEGYSCNFSDNSGWTYGQNSDDDEDIFIIFDEFKPRFQEERAFVTKPRSKIPQRVKHHLKDIEHEFDDIYVAWEAIWENVPQNIGNDPLLIGECGGAYFLIDQWDTSKLETYITKEF